jgi:hypothetical protein
MKSLLASVLGLCACARYARVFSFACARSRGGAAAGVRGGAAFFVALGVAVGMLAGEAGAAISIDNGSGYKNYSGDSIRVISSDCPTSSSSVSNIDQRCVKCNGSTCVITGFTSTQRLLIDPGVNVTFRNLTINPVNKPAVTICDAAAVVSGTSGLSFNNNSGNTCSARTNGVYATEATINLVGSNSFSVGIVGAAFRVPRYAGVIINGPGTLIATGGGRSPYSCADAGAGIGGGRMVDPSIAVACGRTQSGENSFQNPNTKNNANNTDFCGKVTINGGIIAANGGGDGSDAATIDGGNNGTCSFAPGIGGSGNANQGCNLTINGGTVTARGGKGGINDIGPGLRYHTNYTVSGNWNNFTQKVEVTSCGDLENQPENGTANINGGSVNAKIYNISNVTRSVAPSGSSVSVVMQTFIIGSTDETSDKPVTSCNTNGNTGGVTGCYPSSSSAAYGEPTSNNYGIKDVRTDIDGKVYFWLPEGTRLSEVFLYTTKDKEYVFNGYESSSSAALYQGPLPTMDIPIASANSLIGDEVNGKKITGPYTTGFRMSRLDHRAAVGHKITMHKGTYVPNDADANEGLHKVRWCRNSSESQKNELNTKTTCKQIGEDLAFKTAGANDPDTVEYNLDNPLDYGNYIWAEVLVKDGNSKRVTSNATWDSDGIEIVQYPPIQVGVVVKGNLTKGAGLTHPSYDNLIGGENPRANVVITEGSRPNDEYLFLPNEYENLKLSAVASVNGAAVDEFAFNWRGIICANADGTTESIINNLCKSGEIAILATDSKGYFGIEKGKEGEDDKFLTEFGKNPAEFYLPKPCALNDGAGGEATDCEAPKGDLYLDVTIKSGTRPTLTLIKFIKENNTEIASVSRTQNSVTGTITYPFDNTARISKKGTISLVFSDMTTVNDDGKVILSNLSSHNFTLECKKNNTVSSIDCSYGDTELEVGGTYILNIADFSNTVDNIMNEVNVSNIIVQNPASLTWANSECDDSETKPCVHYSSKGYGDSKFIIGAGAFVKDENGEFVEDEDGEKIPVEPGIKGKFTYKQNDGEGITGYCYKWDTLTSAGIPNTTVLAELVCQDEDNNKNNSTFISSNSNSVEVPEYEIKQEDFGKWLRLVVRPKGTAEISGTQFGATVADPTWKQMGVLLLPGEDDNASKRFTNVAFKGCDKSNPDYVGINGCQEDGTGFMVYNNDPNTPEISAVRLSVSLIDDPVKGLYHQLNGWFDDSGNKCESGDRENSYFYCNASYQYATYTVYNISKGKIVITPKVEQGKLPVIDRATLLSINSDDPVDLKSTEGQFLDQKDIAIRDNKLYIQFSYDLDPSIKGSISFVSGTKTIKIYEVNPTAEKSSEVVLDNLPLDISTEELENNIFGRSYKIIVSGFKDKVGSGNMMQTEQFTFTTAEGPVGSDVAMIPDIENYEEGDRKIFAVGDNHIITAQTGDYVEKGGSNEDGYSFQYCWQNYPEQSKTDFTECINSEDLTKSTFDASEYFNQQIRLVVRAKDKNGRLGAPIPTAPELIGVVLKMGIDDFNPNFANANVQNVYLGSSLNVFTKNETTEKWEKTTDEPELAYGSATTIRWSPGVSESIDRLVKWEDDVTPNPNISTKEVASYTLEKPKKDITFKLEIDDGEPMTIKASPGTSNIKLEFSKDVTKFSGLLSISGAGKIWNYDVNKDDYNGSDTTLTIPFTSFIADDGSQYSITSRLDSLGILAGVFGDKSNNFNVANPRLALLSTAKYFMLDITPRNTVTRGEYGSFLTAIEKPIEIRHIGNIETPTLKATLKVCAEADYQHIPEDDTYINGYDNCSHLSDKFSYSYETTSGITAVDGSSDVINIGVLDDGNSVKFKVGIIEGIDAGVYVGRVLIECLTPGGEDCPTPEEIFLTFNVEKKILNIGNPVLTLDNEGIKTYDGYKTIDATLMNGATPWEWSVRTAASFDNDSKEKVDIEAISGSFGDALAGRNKPIDAYYQIVGKKASNYAFGADGSDQKAISGLKGTINQAPLNITFPGGPPEGWLLGEKPFNGLNELESEFVLPIDAKLEGIVTIVEDKEVIEDKVEIDFKNSVFYLADANRGDKDILAPPRTSIVLDGSDAGNYRVGSVDFTGVKGKIRGISIAKNLSPNSGCKEGNCPIEAKITYGDLLVSAYPDNAPDVIVKDETSEEDMPALGGAWVICVTNSNGIVPEGCEKEKTKPYTHIVSPTEEASQDVYAYFAARSLNYERDLVVPLGFKIAPKPITISADLSQAGNKIYDGSKEIVAGNVRASGETRGLVGYDNLLEVKAKSAKFDDENAGNNKLLTIEWDLDENDGTDAGKKYKAGETVTLGSIAKRKVSLEVPTPPTKYYDTYRNISVDPATLGLQAKTDDAGILDADADYAALEIRDRENVTFEFFNPNAGNDKPITSNGGAGDFKLLINGSENANYELVLDELKGNILPASLIYALYEQIKDEEGVELPEDTEKAKSDWFAKNMSLILGKITLADAEITGTYGQPLSEIQNKISSIMPSDLKTLFGLELINNNTQLTWAWKPGEGTKIVGDVGASRDKTVGKAFFMHNDANYESELEFPLPVTATPRQLTATLVPENKTYNGDPYVNVRVIPGNALPSDDVTLTALGIVEDSNAGVDKRLEALVPPSIRWADGIDQKTKDNYILPSYDDNTISPAAVDELKVSIAKAPWPNAVNPTVTESSLLYDNTRNFASIAGLTNGWNWEQPDESFPDPHSKTVNPDNLASINVTRKVLFAPPPEEANYMDTSASITINIRKRSEDNSIAAVGVATECGADTAKVTVTATDANAEIWFNGTSYGTNGTFLASGLNYGPNKISYEVQAQAYGPDFRAYNTTDYTRYLPFSKVASRIRDKSITITLDSSQLSEQEFFSNHTFDIPKTEWYKGTEIVSTGRNIATTTADADDYWIRLYTTDGDIFHSCKMSGTEPALTPLAPPQTAGSIKLFASTFGSRVAPGGSTLTLGTPFGGTISVYTMKGELVSKTHAIDSRTTVKLPSTKGMYIVKLEAK